VVSRECYRKERDRRGPVYGEEYGESKGALDSIETPYANSEDPSAPFKIMRDFLDFAFGVSQDIVADEATDTGGLLQSGYVDVQELNGENSFEKEGK